jgi:hypothetical protein
MAIELHTVWRLVTKETRNLKTERDHLKKLEVPSKDILIPIHRAYHQLVMRIRKGDNLPESLFEPAVELAAACADLACNMPVTALPKPVSVAPVAQAVCSVA